MKNVQQKNESITAERQEKENALTAQLERVQTENAAFAAKNDEIQSSKEAIANQLTQTTKELQEVRSLLASTQEAAQTAADEKIAALQSDAATAQNAKAAAEDRATKLEAENNDLKSKIAENDSMNMEMMSNFEEMVTQLHEATETQSNLSEQLNAKQAQIKDLQLNTSKGAELERQNVELQASIQDLEKSNSDLLETLNETVEKLEEASQVKKNMETEFAEAKTEQQNMSDQLENEVKNLQIKVSEQESINCELKATFDETVAHLEEVMNTKGVLEKQLQAAQAEVTELALNSAASEEVEVLNTQLEQLTATVSTLQEQITQKNNALEEASQNYSTAKQEISVLKENNSVLSFEMQNLEDEKADEETKANEFQQKLTEQQQSIKDMKDQLKDQQTLADETSQEMEEMTADLLAKAEQIKKQTDFIKELETQNVKQKEELLNIQSVTIDVKENLKVVHQRDAAQKELNEVRLALSAEKKAREAAEQAQNAAILEGTTASADSVAMSNKLQIATQQIVELKAEASSKQISWAQRENDLNKTSKQNQTDLQDARQTSKLLQDQLGMANEQLETLYVELKETKDKLQTQIATVNANVNEATQIQNNEETARKLVLQASTANNLMKQKIEKKELELKESVKRCKEVENMMFTEQKRFSELQDATTAAENAHRQKIASLEHDITRLQNQRGQSTAESKRRLEFLEKQNENLVASSKANVEEVVENRKKVANLTMKCERFQQAITKMENRCEELRSEIEEKDSVVTVLQKQVAEHESASLNKIDIEKMEQTNIALRNAVTALENRVKKQKDEVAAANDRSTEQTNSITALQLEIESLQAAVEVAAATSSDNCLAADLDAALEQRNIAQKKVSELSATLKKGRTSIEASKKEVERLKLENQQVASAAQEATSRASTLEVQLQESEHRVATATAELKVNIAANDKLMQEIKGTKASMEKMEKNQAQVSAVATADAEKVLELQQEIEFQNTLLSENDSEVQALKKINHEAKEQLKQQNFQFHSMVDKHNAECRQLETSIDSWSRKYATHKAKALQQYEAVANEAARLGTVEADLRTQVSSLSTKVRDQSSMLREQRNAIAKTQTQSSQTSMKTIELLKTEIQNERARNADKDQRIAKLEQVKLSKHQVQKLMIMKQEHKKFKKENKRLKETVENLACGSKAHSTRSGSDSDDYRRIKSLTQEIEQLRDTTDAANMEVENVKDQLRQHQQAAAEVEKENVQLKDKLLHADISMAQGYKEKEAQYLKEIKYLENENLELMEEISSLRDAAVRRDESVTLNIPSLTKFLADSPAARKPSTDMMSASPAIVGKRTPLSIRAQPNPNIASSATRSMKKTLGMSNSLKKTRINKSLDTSPSLQNSSVIPVHEDEIDVDGPGECNTQ
jgi:chromosome segregation ATPase